MLCTTRPGEQLKQAQCSRMGRDCFAVKGGIQLFLLSIGPNTCITSRYKRLSQRRPSCVTVTGLRRRPSDHERSRMNPLLLRRTMHAPTFFAHHLCTVSLGPARQLSLTIYVKSHELFWT